MSLENSIVPDPQPITHKMSADVTSLGMQRLICHFKGAPDVKMQQFTQYEQKRNMEASTKCMFRHKLSKWQQLAKRIYSLHAIAFIAIAFSYLVRCICQTLFI